MTDDNKAIVLQTGGDFLLPAAPINTILATYQAKKSFIDAVLKPGVDFGTIPGAGDKPALFKAGAEKMTSFFGLAPVFEDITTIEDWTGAEHNGEPFFHYRQRCKLYRGERLIGTGEGSCNSWEKKYRYRQAQRKCPNCGNTSIFQSNKKPEFYCWQKKGGCGATFPLTDKRITDQEAGQVKNPDIADIVNTINKMAQKRALVAAVLIATNISEYFTQDIEDYIDGVIIEATPVKVEQPTVIKREIPVPELVKAQPFPPMPEQQETPELWDEQVLDALAENWNLAKPRLIATLKYCDLPKNSPVETMSVWMTEYKAARDEGQKPAIAAETANDYMDAMVNGQTETG